MLSAKEYSLLLKKQIYVVKRDPFLSRENNSDYNLSFRKGNTSLCSLEYLFHFVKPYLTLIR
jgi:hypothetical protein